MAISDQERQWALAIKLEVEADSSLKPLCDMDYAQYAIVTQGNVENALLRIGRMQQYRETYKVDDSREQAQIALRRLFQQQPGHVLNIDADPERKFSVTASDWSMCKPENTLGNTISEGGKLLDNWDVFSVGSYYRVRSAQPTLEVVRTGFLALFDFHDADIGLIQGVDRVVGLWDEFERHYPMVWKSMLCYNTGTLANVAISLLKKVMRDDMINAINMGCTIVENAHATNVDTPQLKDFFLQPTREAAERKMLARVDELMIHRERNERNFTL